MLSMTCMNCEQLKVGIACASSWVASPLASPIVYVGTAALVAMPAVSDTQSLRDTPHHGGTQKQTPVWKPIVMQAKHQTPCSYCHLPISPGNAIYPWVRPACFAKPVTQDCNRSTEHSCSGVFQGDYTGYMHLHCALKEADGQGVELLPPVSKACLLGGCARHSNCCQALVFLPTTCSLLRALQELPLPCWVCNLKEHRLVCRCANTGVDVAIACTRRNVFTGTRLMLCQICPL